MNLEKQSAANEGRYTWIFNALAVFAGPPKGRMIPVHKRHVSSAFIRGQGRF
jgi:hypothetical protein